MNQFITKNHYRRFPFRQDTAIPFADAVVVVASVVLATDFALAGGAIVLTSVTRALSVTTFVFTITSTVKPGYTLVGSIADAAAEDTRILLAVKLGGVAHPELGYGYLVIGSTASLLGMGPSTVATAVLDSDVVRILRMNRPLSIRVANMNRHGASVPTETPGAPVSYVIENRVASVVAGCVEVTSAPDVNQVRVAPDGTTSEIPIPPPTPFHTEIGIASTTTITVTPVTIADAIPPLPTMYDAQVDGAGPVPASPIIDEGHNIELSGYIVGRGLRFSYRLGGGQGLDCAGVMGYTLPRLAKDCVKSLNGVHTSDGHLTLTSGAGISFLSDPAGHRILMLVNAEDLKRVSP